MCPKIKLKLNKKILIIFYALITNLFFSQIGIKTTNPKAKLDINGSLLVRKEILLPVDPNFPNGNTTPGEPGDFMFSTGNMTPPIWKKIQETKWGIGQTILLNYDPNSTQRSGSFYKTEPGVTYYDGYVSGFNMIPAIEEDSGIGDMYPAWDVLPYFTSYFFVTKNNSKLGISFQTTMLTNTLNYFQGAEASVGIFIDGKLKSVSSLQSYKANKGFSQILLFDVLEDLMPKTGNQSYKVEVAVRRRLQYLSTLNPLTEEAKYMLVGLGNETFLNGTDSNTNDFMNQGNLTLTLYEPN